MLIDYLINKVIDKNKELSNKDNRQKIGLLGGFIGTILNLLLFIIKLSIGLLVSSIAIQADAFNNLTDAATSVITILSFKLSNLPPDKEHPYGHGRIEYISALIVAFMVMFVGFQFTKSSIDRIRNPEPVLFQMIPFLILTFSIGIKIWMGFFYKKSSEKISSITLKATSIDAFSDVITSLVVNFSLLTSLFTDFPLDGYIGLIVSIMIIYAGYSLVKETISPLIGEAPDKDLADSIKEQILEYDYITGVHDLLVHNYGPGKIIASIHAEFPSTIDVMTIHEIIDKAERKISSNLNIHLVIHMDPIDMESEEIIKIRNNMNEFIKDYPMIISLHDFRLAGKNEDNKTNLIFDIIVDADYLNDRYNKLDFKKEFIKDIKKRYPEYYYIISINKEFY